MSTKKTGFNARIKRVRIRLGFESAASFADAAGVGQNTYGRWEKRDSSPQIASVKAAFRALRDPVTGFPVRDLPTLFYWIADGDGSPPSWLDDEGASPWGPEEIHWPDGTPPPTGSEGLVAMPESALKVGREAFRILDSARQTGTLRDPPALKAWNVLEGEECFSCDDDLTVARTSRSARAA